VSPDDRPARRRTYDWSDPHVVASAVTTRSGMELLAAMRDGALPPAPISATMGMDLIQVDDGLVVFTLEPREWHYNQTGGAHGGVHATLLDSAMGCAVHTRLPAGTSYTTLDISVRYLRAVRVDTGPVRCEGEVISLGRRVATAQGRITDAAGKVLATGTTTCLISSAATGGR
jgi:uncharacterized protein (TIGR00369 family)